MPSFLSFIHEFVFDYILYYTGLKNCICSTDIKYLHFLTKVKCKIIGYLNTLIMGIEIKKTLLNKILWTSLANRIRFAYFIRNPSQNSIRKQKIYWQLKLQYLYMKGVKKHCLHSLNGIQNELGYQIHWLLSYSSQRRIFLNWKISFLHWCTGVFTLSRQLKIR